MHNDPFIVSRALKIGANGYILKDTPGEEIVKAFERVRDGTPYLSHELASEVAFMEARGRTPYPLGSITVRELQILSLLAEGKPYGQIAGSLNVSYKTIANTCGQLKAKLGVRSLPELMRIAIECLPSTPGAVGSPQLARTTCAAGRRPSNICSGADRPTRGTPTRDSSPKAEWSAVSSTAQACGARQTLPRARQAEAARHVSVQAGNTISANHRCGGPGATSSASGGGGGAARPRPPAHPRPSSQAG
jgi:DNA-binding CsgD family transcriptional regulator